MTQNILQTLGGLGMFLLAMLVMTEGLRGLAGNSLHSWLTLFTRSPATGALTGTVVTGLLQSSSATIVATVGFVAAGLLTFPQSLGVVLGANVGTTITGWLVAFFGFKLKLGIAAMPLVLGGMLLKIFSRGRLAEAGKAMAGFALMLIGIGLMQSGMSALEGMVTPSSFPPDTFTGRLLLVGIGIIITLITQSSSAGVAIAMTALSIGSINFPQAAAMVIGMNVGTTVTAVIATIGSSEAARRTGLSHTIYNLLTAVIALLMLSPYLRLLNTGLPNLLIDNPAFALVGFHTLFNVAALVVVLPMAGLFASLMEKLVPERDTSLARRLDKRLLREPQAAQAALDATLQEGFGYMLQGIQHQMKFGTFQQGPSPGQVRQELLDTRDFLDEMNRAEIDNRPQHVTTAIHTLDHLRRLLMRLQQSDCISTLRNETRFEALREELLALCKQLQNAALAGIEESLYKECLEFAEKLRINSEDVRDRTIRKAVRNEINVAQSGQWLAAYRWLDRVAHHVWRVSAHLGGYDIEYGAEFDKEDMDGPV
jgi:phosphate:Na+ symporter